MYRKAGPGAVTAAGAEYYLQADEGLRTLVDFRYKRHYKADRGRHGEGKNMHGRRRRPGRTGAGGTLIKDDDTVKSSPTWSETGRR
jgi:GTP-binding protein